MGYRKGTLMQGVPIHTTNRLLVVTTENMREWCKLYHTGRKRCLFGRQRGDVVELIGVKDDLQRKVSYRRAVMALLISNQGQITLYSICVREHGRKATNELVLNYIPSLKKSPSLVEDGIYMLISIKALPKPSIAAASFPKRAMDALDVVNPRVRPTGAL